MLHRVALVRSVGPVERIASIIRVGCIKLLGTTKLAVATYFLSFSWLLDFFHSDDRGYTFLRNVASYRSHTP
jgi:hypothetical protein